MEVIMEGLKFNILEEEQIDNNREKVKKKVAFEPLDSDNSLIRVEFMKELMLSDICSRCSHFYFFLRTIHVQCYINM